MIMFLFFPLIGYQFQWERVKYLTKKKSNNNSNFKKQEHRVDKCKNEPFFIKAEY